MGLKEYRNKRHFEETTEPAGGKKKSKQKDLQFVVQEHHASHLHYDFRLEVEGVLKSWAIPKGPSLDPSIKRLAVQVEDHPFEYRTFEGTIPEGNYGAGTVKIWDKGTYQAEGASTSQESERLMQKGLLDGHLNFIMKGHTLKGTFSLIRLRGGQSKQWLLIKKKDEHATSSSPTPSIKKSPAPSKRSSKSKEEKTPAGFQAVKPMLATLVDQPFDAKEWIFETKWDGYRALADIQKDQVYLYSRNLQSFEKRFPALLDDLRLIQAHAVLDGEIVVLDEQDKPSFQLVQNYQRTQTGTLIYYIFDLLYLEGEDLRSLPLIKRKALLKKLLPHTPHLRYCEHVKEKGKVFFKAALKEDLEGVIAKRAQSSYQEGRSRDWLKIKTQHRQEVIICGFTPPKGAREKFGALLLGVYDQNHLIYVGQTGSGFDHQKLTDLHKRLQSLTQATCPFKSPPKIHSSVTWVKPQIVCEVKFAEWTNDELMRQAIFIDVREDKEANEVVPERTIDTQNILTQQTGMSTSPIKVTKTKKKSSPASSLELTHLDKIYWPEESYTKGDLIDYYKQVAPLILPYLKDRAEILRRYPNGIEGASFYQKEIEKLPEGMRTEIIQHKDHEVHYLFIEDERSLLYAINLGCIDLNPFNSRLQFLDFPDYLVIDLDPEAVTFDEVVQVAQTVHAVLNKWKIPSVCKTSGATGLHIYIPMGARYPFEKVKQFAELLVQMVHQQLPQLTSLERSPTKRQKKVYLDYLQNNFAQTIVAPYSVRPRPGAPVSTPLKWSEVKKGLNPLDFTIKTVLTRFEKLGDLFHPVLEKGINLPSLLKKMKA